MNLRCYYLLSTALFGISLSGIVAAEAQEASGQPPVSAATQTTAPAATDLPPVVVETQTAAPKPKKAKAKVKKAAAPSSAPASPSVVTQQPVPDATQPSGIPRNDTAPALGDASQYHYHQFEGVLWPVVQQRPPHLLPKDFESWDALLQQAADRVLVKAAHSSPYTWGERNRAAICHPIAMVAPVVLNPILCMPDDPLPGDFDMPRVQAPRFGAAQRMVVSPGREQDGIMHMPAGQSGHPLSPFWSIGHDDWVRGRSTQFLPSATVHRLLLK